MRILLRPFRWIAVLLPMVVIATVAFKAGTMSQQVHMQAAWDALESARKHLDEAVADKGGHRAKAIRLVHDALIEVRAGIEYARTH
jgi:hypothetical protein